MRSSLIYSGVVIFMVGCLMAEPAVGQTVIVQDGEARASLVLAAQPTTKETRAADELQMHISRMSGAVLPIVTSVKESTGIPIYIGSAAPPAERKKLNAHSQDNGALRVHVTPKAVYLVGNTDEGTLYAVYTLLYDLGVRWLIPQEIGLDIPVSATVALQQQDLFDVPAYCGRILQAIGDREWAARNRLGGFNAGAHGLGPKFDREKEPELFYVENGKPTNQERVSSPEVLRRVIEYWRARLKANPDMKYISVGPHDGSGFGDDPWDAEDFDPIIGKTATTDRYIKFFNLILDDLQKDYPDVGLAFYAYTLEMRPPVRETPNPKILPMLAAIALDRFHSIDNPLSWEKKYLRTVIDGWQATGVNMMFRGYLFNLADQGLPFSMIDIVRDEWPFYHSKGFIAMRVECIVNWAYHAPALYLAARLYWDPYQDSAAILDEWFERMYGPAAVAMKEHFAILEEAYVNGDYYTGNVYDVPKIVTPAVRKQLGRTLKRAEKAARSNKRAAQRVHIVRIGYDYGEANFEMMDAFMEGRFVEAKKYHDLIVDKLIPAAIAQKPPVISPRSHVGYFKRFWSLNVTRAYECVSGGNELAVLFPDEWLFFLDPYGAGDKLFLQDPSNGTQPWQPILTRSQTASNQGLRYFKWTGWYRTSFTVPKAFAGRKLHFWMGGVDDTPRVWIDGQELKQLKRGAAPLGRPFEFDATAAVTPGQEQVVVVSVADNSMNELGTFGINGPVMIWAEAPVEANAEDAAK